MRTAIIAFSLLVLVGCESNQLAYKPAERPGGIDVAADYVVLQDKLQVTLDTKGIKVDKAAILRGDGRAVPPQSIQHPRPPRDIQLGVGTGYVGMSHRAGTTVGVGASDTSAYDRTILWFPMQVVGSGPWKLQIKMGKFEPYVIELPLDDNKVVSR